MNKEELLKEFNDKVEQLRNELFSKLEDDKKEFELTYPKNKIYVYYISCVDGSICDRYFDIEDSDDKLMFENGQYFKTKEEAEQHLKERKLLFKIKKWAKMKNGDWAPDWSDYSENKFTIYHDGEDGILRIGAGSICNNITVLPVFKTREIAQECIEVFGEEIKEVLC